MRTLSIATTLLSSTLAAQGVKQEKVEPAKLVSRAEKLLQQKQVEDAVLVLWQALDLLATLPSNPVHDSTALSARFLLKENDARETQRRAVFASVGKQQVELAAAYRAKKWLDTAETRLHVADGYDRDAGAKERAALEAARPKSKPADAATPKGGPEPAANKLSPLLQRTNTEFVYGEWKEVGDALECQAPPGSVVEWVTTASHGDHEIVVEFRPVDPSKDHNATLAVGLVTQAGVANYGGYRLQCSLDAAAASKQYPKQYGLTLWVTRGANSEQLGETTWVKGAPGADGFHRVSIQVRGPSLRAQLDHGAPLEVAAPADVRGRVGLLQGVSDATTCAVQFRNLRVDPLPADPLTDAEQRAKDEAANQDALTKAVADAKELIAKKEPEPASVLLREALGRVAVMSAGVLRDNLQKSIEQMLTQTDPIWARRKKTAQAIATQLVTLADEYGKAGLYRAALVLVERSASFDPEGQAARLAAAQQAVAQWNIAQAKARASELAPPADDGTVLREWFGQGRVFVSYGVPIVVDGAVARAEALTSETLASWAPPLSKPRVEVCSVYVNLPAVGANGGLIFDALDSTRHGIVMLERHEKGMRLFVNLRVGEKWVPLGMREVEMDAWRRDGWHQITVESNATGLVATCGNTKLQVPRGQLGKPAGEIGLYAFTTATGPVTIQFCAFAVGK
ncbi:MAG TPA: hypothetical protein VFD82_06505 [Planctomycetota bacterium]|nr:hypothetical protein [Planctomycetota bacterium]